MENRMDGASTGAAAARTEAASPESRSTSPFGVQSEGGAKEPDARASMSSSARWRVDGGKPLSLMVGVC